MRSSFLRAIACSLLLLLSGCSKITITEPLDGTVTLDKPVLYQINFVNGIPTDFQVVLNSADVTELFTITETGAVADGESLAGYVFSGKNQFSIVLGSDNRVVNSVFHYDDTGPQVHILSADHETGLISGYVADPSGVSSLSIDGSIVPVFGQNEFETTFTSQSFNEISAIDNNGFTSKVVYARGDQELYPSMSLRLNNGGFAYLADQAEIALNEYDFEGLLKPRSEGGINPVASDPEVTFKSFYFDGVDVQITVLDNKSMDIHIELHNFLGEIRARPLLFTHSGRVTMDTLVIDTEVLIGIDNSDLSVGISNTVVNLDGLNIEIDGLFGNLLGSLITGLAPVFMTIAETTLVPVVSDFIGGILIETDITIDEKILHAMISPTYLETFDHGLTVDINTSITSPEPSDVSAAQLGSVFTEGDVPSLGQTSPNGTVFDVGVSISANLINQGLYAAHEAGITHFVLTSGDSGGTDPEGVSVIQSPEDDIQTQDIITLRILPASPPFINLMDNDNIHGMLGWHDVSLEFDLQRVGWTEAKTVFTTTFNLDVGFELGATDEGFLHIGIERLPIIEIMEFDMPGQIMLTPQFVNKIVDYVMPTVLPNLSARLDSVLLPTIGGYRIHADELWVSGSGSSNFSVAGTLVEEAVTAASTAPTSSLNLTTNTVLDVVSVENGEAQIEMSEGANGTGEPLEYRYRVDGGGWSNWRQRKSISLSRMFGGHHIVEVCSRTVLMKQEINCPTTEFDTTVAP
ncbi:MAG: hypothetical protein KUG82_03440 [Pseudomonadales bacterium]|nr:hypothetical protein [Pseudomonadales bacterium]